MLIRMKNVIILVILFMLSITSFAHAGPPPPKPLIEISASSSNETVPAIAYSTESRTYLVAYENDDHVQVRMYNAFGDPLTQTSYDFGVGTYWPAVAYNNLHDLYGLTFVSDFATYSSIVMCWINGNTQNVITCDEIYQGAFGESILLPSIAFNNNDSNDDFMIVWQEGNLGDWSIYGHRTTPTNPYTGVGSRIEIAVTTLVSPTVEEAFSEPDVTYNLNMNEYLVVFEYWTNASGHTTGSDILARRIYNNGDGPAPLPLIPVDISACSQTRPTVAAYRLNKNTPYFVAYQDDWNWDSFHDVLACDTETSIRGIYLEQDGTLPNPAAYINVSANYQIREAYPDITASEALGAYTITWAKDSGTNMDIYLRHIDPSSGLREAPILISGDEANVRGDESLPVVAGGAPSTMVAWHEFGWGTGTGDVIGWIDANFVFLPMIMK